MSSEDRLRAQVQDLERRLADAVSMCCSGCRPVMKRIAGLDATPKGSPPRSPRSEPSFFGENASKTSSELSALPSVVGKDDVSSDMSRLSQQALQMLAIFEDDTVSLTSEEFFRDIAECGDAPPALLATFSKSREVWSMERSSSRSSSVASQAAAPVHPQIEWPFVVVWMVCGKLTAREQQNLSKCSRNLSLIVKAVRAQSERLKLIKQFRSSETTYADLIRFGKCRWKLQPRH